MDNIILISHRGNLRGRNIDLENKIEYIEYSLSLNYNVEIDVRYYKSKMYLGHDVIQEEVPDSYYKNSDIWFHAKNGEALEVLKQKNVKNYFYHSNDDYSIVSNGYIWTNTLSEPTKYSIIVLPEKLEIWSGIFSGNYNVAGICSDFVGFYKDPLKV